MHLVPGRQVWIDLLVPSDDPLWDDDVGRAMHWVGRCWTEALSTLGVSGKVHERGLVSTPASSVVCFAGLGPGEVTVGGRKVVGVSQRRTRQGARFQTATLLDWVPHELSPLLAPDAAEQVHQINLDGVAAGVDRPLYLVEAALLAALDAGCGPGTRFGGHGDTDA